MSKQQRDAIDVALRAVPFGLSQDTAGPGLGGRESRAGLRDCLARPPVRS